MSNQAHGATHPIESVGAQGGVSGAYWTHGRGNVDWFGPHVVHVLDGVAVTLYEWECGCYWWNRLSATEERHG